MNKAFLVAFLSMLFVIPLAFGAGNMKAFPPPEKGMVRYVLNLDEKSDETAFQVELMVGKTVETDQRNIHFFAGKIEKETVKGWGYTRYVVHKIGPMAGTLMAVDPKEPKVERFIKLGGEPYLVRYNSKLPVVVYVPEGTEVRYRIWRADPEIKAMEKG
jgi:ecotin